jgi:PKD repeat protein
MPVLRKYLANNKSARVTASPLALPGQGSPIRLPVFGILLLWLLLFSAHVLAGSVTLAWDPVTSVSIRGYNVYYGPVSGGALTQPIKAGMVKVDVGNVTTYTVGGLPEGSSYYFAVSDYDAANESGLSAQVSATVPYSAPVAQFNASATSGYAPLAMNFLDASTGSITTYAWTFGDGGTSSTQNPSHVYSVAGTYSVGLTVSGPGGSNALTKSGYITVSAAPVAPIAAFTASTTSGIAPLTVNFTSTSTGTISTYAWTFGDGGTSSAQNPSHVYAAPGTYTVTLAVSGPGGSDAMSKISYLYLMQLDPLRRSGQARVRSRKD